MQFVEANGAKIPAIGLGTWDLRGRTCARAVEQALRLGYRHIDTAEMYDNEREVGEGLRASRRRARRGRHHHQGVADPSGAARVRALDQGEPGAAAPLRGRPAADPLAQPADPARRDDRRAVQDEAGGFARHIGVSNFTVPMIDEAVRLATEPLVTNQIEWHPYLDQSQGGRRRAARPGCRSPPTRRSRAAARPATSVLQAIGAAHKKTAGQVACATSCRRARRHPAHLQGRAAGGEFGHLRLRAERCRDGGDPHARPSERPHRQLGRRAGLG